MRHQLQATIIVVGLVNGPLGAVDYQTPPEIQIVTSVRVAEAIAGPEGAPVVETKTSTEGGPFVHTFTATSNGLEGTMATAYGSQDTTISSFSIRGEGEVFAVATVSENGWSDSRGSSSLQVTFKVPVDTDFSLGGTVDSSIFGMATAHALVSLSGTDEEGQPIFLQELSQSVGSSGGEIDFLHFDTLKANTTVTLTVDAIANHFFSPGSTQDARASFEIDFDLGDRDGDGLMDAWEEEGIDIGGDGSIDINLKAMGANPDHKDIFVEVDIMAGVAFGPTSASAIQDVISAFAKAPAALVKNPDGKRGVNLHVIYNDGDAPGGSAQLTGVDWPDRFDPIKQEFFGSLQQRNHPKWGGASGMQAALAKIFRYCLWASTLTLENPKSGLQESTSGFGELPGNDFVVAAGSVATWWPSTIRNALAGTFMHELGHTLGLRHGGKDGVNYKPNYLSVMSYSLQVPWDRTTAQGTNAKFFWDLDYSRKAARTLDENRLDEAKGIDGAPGRFAIFNSAADANPPLLTIASANASSVNWDFLNPFPDPETVMRDITRFISKTDVYDSELKSYVDWDSLWYHLSGDGNFDDGAARDTDSLEPNIDLATVQEILSAEWADQTALTPEVFWDDFETGDTSAWSSSTEP